MAIVWNTNSTKNLARAVRNFNNKIKRLEKSERDLILPKTTSISELKKEINNKWELNRKIKELERYSKRGIEETITTKGGVEMSRYTYENIQREQKRLYDKLGRTIKKIENITPTTFGIKEDVTYKQMGSEQLANLRARRKNIGSKKVSTLSKTELNELVKLINITKAREQYQEEVFRNNYMDKMLFGLGYYAGVDSEIINNIRLNMNKLTDKQFMDLFNNDLGIQMIRDFYPEVHNKNPEDIKEQVNMLYEELNKNIVFLVDQYKK